MTADLSPDDLRTAGPVLDCAARLFAEHGPRSPALPALTHRIAEESGATTTPWAGPSRPAGTWPVR